MDAHWKVLTGGALGEPLRIVVQGRELTLPCFANGVCRADFVRLCGQPLGPADYLALARSVRTLLIDDIPLLSREKFDQAKRFVTLIDALYEAKTQLLCSAAAEPDGLYPSGDGSFEFQRTASRLWEMRAEDWRR